jgi:hypothetical protein
MENNIEWRDIPGYEGYYKIKFLNEAPWCIVKSLERTMVINSIDPRSGKKLVFERTDPEREYPPNIQKSGKTSYYMTTLKINKVSKRIYIHNIIAKFLLPNPDNLPIVRHLNDNGLDNRLDNLEWGTHKTNAEDRSNNGGRGAYHLNKELVEEIKSLQSLGLTSVSISKKLGLPYRCVWRIITGRGYKHLQL